MSSTMTERFNVSGAMLVALYGEPSREREYFRSRARKVADIGIKMAMLNRLFFIALTSVAAIATAFAYGIGGHLAISGGSNCWNFASDYRSASKTLWSANCAIECAH